MAKSELWHYCIKATIYACVVCGGKMAWGSFVYKVSCLLWNLELRKTNYLNTFQECIKSFI